MPQQDYLDLIRKYESGGQNVTNYNYGQLTPEGKKQTAQGYYQITDTNWNRIAPQVGIDLNAYPSAMAASEADQRKVANYLLTQTPEGISHWADFNPRLKSVLSDSGLRTSGKIPDYQDSWMPQEQQVATQEQAEDLSKISTEELLKRVKGQDPDMAKQLQDQFDALKPKEAPKAAPQVKAPEKGFLRRYAESTPAPWEDPLTLGGGSTMRAAIRSVLPGEESASQRFGDIGRASSGVAETAMALAPFGQAARGATASLEELPSVYKSLKGLLGGFAGGYGAQKLAEASGLPPEVQESAGLLGGVAGGALGPRLGFPNFSEDTTLGRIVRHPGVQNAAIRKIPLVGGVIADIRAGNIQRPAAPAETVKPPTPPTRAESMEMLRLGQIDEQRFLEHEADRGSSPRVAQEQLATIKARIAEKQPKIQPVALAPTVSPDQIRGGPLFQGTTTQATLPEGVQIKTATPTPPPNSTSANLPQVNPPPAPPQQPLTSTTQLGLGQQPRPNLPVNFPSTNPSVNPALGTTQFGGLPIAPESAATPEIAPEITPKPKPTPALKKTHSDEVAEAAIKAGKTAEDLRNVETIPQLRELRKELGIQIKSIAALRKAADKMVGMEKVPGSRSTEFTSKTTPEGTTTIKRTTKKSAARGDLPVLTPEQQKALFLFKGRPMKP